jgi:hypothetical protein
MEICSSRTQKYSWIASCLVKSSFALNYALEGTRELENSLVQLDLGYRANCKSDCTDSFSRNRHTRFLDHTQRRATIGRTPLDEWSARRRNLYLAAHNTHNRQTSTHPVRFEPTIAAGERRRPTPYTARSLGPASTNFTLPKCKLLIQIILGINCRPTKIMKLFYLLQTFDVWSVSDSVRSPSSFFL